MKWFLVVLLSLLGFSCGRSSAQATSSPTEELRARTRQYLQLGKYGWEAYNDCDALLFASLSAVGHNREFDVVAAREPNDRWQRRPSMDCLSEGSTISRDMFMGLFVYAWHFKRLDIMEGIWDYGVSHGWKMGEDSNPLDTRTIFTPGLVGLTASLIYHLGGADHGERHIPQIYSTDPGFVSHLTLLHLYMNGEMVGSLTDSELHTVDKILEHMGNNPLPQALRSKYTDGNQSTAVRLLLNIWPEGRLPTGLDWSTEWRTQRSDSEIHPGTSATPHSGGDFLFVALIILGEVDSI